MRLDTEPLVGRQAATTCALPGPQHAEHGDRVALRHGSAPAVLVAGVPSSGGMRPSGLGDGLDDKALGRSADAGEATQHILPFVQFVGVDPHQPIHGPAMGLPLHQAGRLRLDGTPGGGGDGRLQHAVVEPHGMAVGQQAATGGESLETVDEGPVGCVCVCVDTQPVESVGWSMVQVDVVEETVAAREDRGIQPTLHEEATFDHHVRGAWGQSPAVARRHSLSPTTNAARRCHSTARRFSGDWGWKARR